MTNRPKNVWTMTEFRKNFDAVIEAVERGEVQIITRYGKPYRMLRPVTEEEIQKFSLQDDQKS